jgi:hypothetical protein
MENNDILKLLFPIIQVEPLKFLVETAFKV